MSDKRVCLGAIAGAHGLRGDVRIKTFTAEPLDISAYGPLQTEDGAQSFMVMTVKPGKGDTVIARLQGLVERDRAEALKGERLYVNRKALPPPDDDEFYYEDIIGLNAVHIDGRSLGRVRAVFNHGAGDLLELVDIPGVKGARLIPFTRDCVPAVDISSGRVEIDPPLELIYSEEDRPQR